MNNAMELFLLYNGHGLLCSISEVNKVMKIHN